MRDRACVEGLSIETLARTAEVLRELAHPHRLKIVELLDRAGQAPVHELVARLRLPQAATSQHLSHLRRVGIVAAARRGKEVWYTIADPRSIKVLNCIRAKAGGRKAKAAP